jgi:signal transduction histidine kinase
MIDAAFGVRAPFSVEYRRRRGGGDYQHVWHVGAPRDDADGEFAGYAGAIIDVDARAGAADPRQIAGRLIAAHEDERGDLARELHDDVSQQLAVLAIDLELLGASASAPDATERARRALALAEGAAKSVHALSHRLLPSKLHLVGLVSALTELQRERSRSGFTVTFTHDRVPPDVPRDVAVALFRIAQEAVQNAAQHSGADGVRLHLNGVADRLRLTIVDDGAGFDVQARAGTGLGLAVMRERLAPLGGAVTIRSAPGAGTHIEASAPVAPRVPADDRKRRSGSADC